MLDPEGHKRKTAANRANSPEVLTTFGFSFDAKNNGAHLVVQTSEGVVDFWPGTGLFAPRWDVVRSGRGVFALCRQFKPTVQAAPLPGAGETPIQRAPHMTDYTVATYRKLGFTIVEE